MTNLQAIDLLKGLEQSLDDYCELNDEGKTAFGMAITALELFGNAEQLPPAQPEQRWIPCSERLPYAEDGNSGILLVTCGYKNVEDTSIRWVRRLWFDGEYWNDVDGERYNQIVYAWMPLPKPYKEERKDNE